MNETKTAESQSASTSSSNKRKGRRRRNKKDIVLDFRKTGKKRNDGQADVMTTAEFYRRESANKKSRKGKISLKTSSRDYDGTLGLPEEITQREFESTGQFFRRLDRLTAKARVEANLETRFDMTLKSKIKEQSKKGDTNKQVESDDD